MFIVLVYIHTQNGVLLSIFESALEQLGDNMGGKTLSERTLWMRRYCSSITMHGFTVFFSGRVLKNNIMFELESHLTCILIVNLMII